MTFWGGESGHWKAWISDIRNPWNNCLRIPYAEAPQKKSSIWKQTSGLSWLKIGSVTSHIRRLVARHWESFGRIRFLRDSSTRRRLQLLPKSQSLNQRVENSKDCNRKGHKIWQHYSLRDSCTTRRFQWFPGRSLQESNYSEAEETSTFCNFGATQTSLIISRIAL